MISKFDGICCYCNKPTRAGLDEYDDRKAFHLECRDNRPPGPEAFQLADRLGYIRSGDPIPALWFTWNPAAPVRETETLSLFEY